MDLRNWIAGVALASACIASSPAAATMEMISTSDRNGDGIREIVAFEIFSSRLSLINGATGVTIWDETVSSKGQTVQSLFKRGLAVVPNAEGPLAEGLIAVGAFELLEFFDHSGQNVKDINVGSIDPDVAGNVTAVEVTRSNIDGFPGFDILVGYSSDLDESSWLDECGSGANGVVYAFSSKTHKLLWKRQGPAGSDKFGRHVLALSKDYNNDGIRDILTTDICRKTGSMLFKKKGSIFILSGNNGLILKQFPNPYSEFAATGALFGTDVVETSDVNGDGFPELVVGSPVFGTANPSRIQILSGKDGKLLCDVSSPTDPSEGFGYSLAGGNFRFGEATDTAYPPFKNYPQDVLVGAPGNNSAYVIRLDSANGCKSEVLATFTGGGTSSAERVETAPPLAGATGQFVDFLVEQFDGVDEIRRYSGKDAALKLEFKY